ncbi:MAG: hypothetical protein KC418_24310 [Anaerolineales bacterium]|nr:hypothetical protein [Anaerolineales bacterium]
MRNLDQITAETAQCIINETISLDKNKVEGLTTKALGVLQENGVYAVTLFLFSRTNKEEKESIAPVIRKFLLEVAADEIVKEPAPENQAGPALEFITKHISGNLDVLLLVKEIWEQTLIYARYGAKART